MRKKLMSLLLALAMVFSLTVSASALDDVAEGTIVILHTNDVHGAIAGYAKVAALKKAYQDAGAYVILADAGDFIQGDPTVSVGEGKNAVELMNLAGYDVAAPGNHEFDYGYENLKELEKAAEFPIICANILSVAETVTAGDATVTSGTSAFKTSTVFTAPDGTKIGFFGLDTPETATKAHPAKIQGIRFDAGESMFKDAELEVKNLKAAGCKYVVCLGHLGIDDESKGNRSIDLMDKVEGIDVLIDGHSHSTLEDVEAVANGKPITSTGTKLANIGVVTIAPDGTITRENLSTEELETEKAVADRAAAIQKQIDDDYGATFAKTETLLNGEKDPGNRTEETNLGDLITDALVWGAEKNGESVNAAITNGGGIRAAINEGDITKKDVNTVLPFGNTLSIVKVTGAELLEALEASTFCTPTAVGGFPQVSGITFKVNTAAEFDEGDLYPGSTYHKPNSIKRVTIETVGGEPFDADATYAIATNDFMAAGGDTYYAFAAATANYDLGIPMDEVLMDYIKEELKGVVTADAYGEPAGRITIEAAEAAEAPAEEPAPAPAPEPEPAPAPAPVQENLGVETNQDISGYTESNDTTGVVASNKYTVQKGDCLWNIARRVYGDGSKWQLIYKANSATMKNPNVLDVGQVLVIPAA